MKAETKAEWVAALRSGNYQQGQGRLRSGDQYCCLGVFCDLFGGGRWVERKSVDETEYLYEDCEGNLLPHHLTIKMCTDHDISFKDMNYLVALNDYKYNFKQIADHIEANL